ncbi:hypothetical protein [Methylobacterium durans]|uniref:Uncharacterized protein n=1 Tax=Methylobacterium durans TaxID=2202825 RepID=A0A2U8WBZ2_9HYPH|nr:hypothetical protein [Methylobacterium durans]AWN43121.1 hypothetical protein DK389_24795 [Methylobacterium durans]
MEGGSVVIGIHGLANKPPEDEKARWWKTAIREGLARNGAAPERDFDFAFVYWADLRHDTPLDDARNREPYAAADGLGALPRYDPERDAGRTSLTGRLYHRFGRLQAALGVTPLDDVLLEFRLDDLWNYHQDADFRNAARARLIDRLRRHAGRRILLAAHSMGSIIAYDCLRILERAGEDVRVAHLVTLGAPLGLVEVKAAIEAEHGDARVPGNVLAWTNLTDPADVATVAAALRAEFAPSGRGVLPVDVPVINAYRRPDGEANHHKSYGYLRTPEFSDIVLAFIGGTRRAAAGAPEACARSS